MSKIFQFEVDDSDLITILEIANIALNNMDNLEELLDLNSEEINRIENLINNYLNPI